jgi:hypothetical protein
VLVGEGVKAGERVIVEGVLKVRPGAKVKIVQAAADQSGTKPATGLAP